MPTITALTVQKRNKERINLEVDGVFFCGISLEHAVKNGLSVGMDLSESDLVQLSVNSEEQDFFNKALTYLLRSPKTERQIRTYLASKQCPSGIIERVSSRLRELNYINDEAYAKLYAEQKGSKLGVRAIRNKMLVRGIDRKITDETISEIKDQTELAKTLAEKYMSTRDNTYANLQKLFRYLMGKGFELELARDIVEGIKSSDAFDNGIEMPIMKKAKKQLSPEEHAALVQVKRELSRAKAKIMIAKRGEKRKKQEYKTKKSEYKTLKRKTK